MILNKLLKIGIIIFIITVIGNLLVLNLWTLETNNLIKQINTSSNTKPENLNLENGKQNQCPQDCISKIDQIKSSADEKNPTGTSTNLLETNTNSQSIKEAYVPFGAGSGNKTDWADVTGLISYIDGSKYGNIQKAVFEASVRIPNGNQIIWIVLYNITDKSYLWSSQVSMSGDKPLFLVSKTIVLPQANKLYQVRMKTEIGDVAYIDQSRLHIIAE